MTTGPQNPRNILLPRDRFAIAAVLFATCAIAWLLLLQQAAAMAHMDSSGMPSMHPLAVELALLFLMWASMMAAMMLPGITPMVAAFATINRRRRQRDAPYVATAVFVSGYLIAWSGFGAVAAVLQWLLSELGLLSRTMQATSPTLTAGLFLLAGFYQLSPLKDRCLMLCRSPVGFVLSQWRDGALGAVIMGIWHGVYCIGCCGALMLLLFAVAVMDLRWVAALSLLLTAEKLLPRPKLWRRLIAGLLILLGLWLGIAPMV
jgi:predicted metal-binding membrane protein